MSKDRNTVLLPNRIATFLLVAFGAAAAVLPVLANMDWQSTAGILGGLGAVSAAIVTYLRGWQQNEDKNLERYQPNRATAVLELQKQLRAANEELARLHTESAIPEDKPVP